MDPLRLSSDVTEKSPPARITERTGFLPETGKFTVPRWAEFFGVSEPTFRRWLSKYRVPTRKPGAVLIVDAQDFWERIPLEDFPLTEPEEPLEAE